MSPLLPNRPSLAEDLISFKIKEEEDFSEDSVSEDKKSEDSADEGPESVNSEDFDYFNEVSIDQLSSGTPRFDETLAELSEHPMGSLETLESCQINDLKD